MMMMAEMVCFVYIGLSLTDAFVDHYENIVAALVLLGGWLAGRALMLGIFAIFLSRGKKMRIRGKEWAYLITSGLIKGPLAYIFANIIVAKSVPCIDTHNYAIYKTVLPLFIVQLAVVISLVLGTPLNYIVAKCCVTEDSHEDQDILMKRDIAEDFKTKVLDNVWELDLHRPRAFYYMDEFVIKPFLIRDYHKRKKYIYKLKSVFEKDEGMYMHGEGHGDHGHGDHGDHGHGDHGHGEHGGHGHGDHGHGHDKHGHDNHNKGNGHSKHEEKGSDDAPDNPFLRLLMAGKSNPAEENKQDPHQSSNAHNIKTSSNLSNLSQSLEVSNANNTNGESVGQIERKQSLASSTKKILAYKL